MGGFAFAKDSTSKSILVMLRDTASSPAGQGKTGLAYNTAGLTVYYTRGETGTPTAITLATQTSTGAWSSGGFVAKDGTNAPGLVRLDLPNAALATGVDRVYVTFKLSGIFDETVCIDLLNDDPYSAAPTTTQIADAIFQRDLSGLTAGATKSLLGWMLSGGMPLSRVVISGSTITFYEEDGVTVADTLTLGGSSSVSSVTR